MSKSKHTPGPWWFKRIDTPTDKFSQSGERICERRMVIGDKEDWVLADMDLTEANARLIAAAPELLEALQLFAFAEDAWHNVVKYMNANGDAAPSALAIAFERARAAIAKATGENHE